MWIHYGSAKVGRGELMDAMGMLAYLNQMVFGPLSLMEAGKKPNGLRHIERDASQRMVELLAVQADNEAADCTRALCTAIALYQSLRSRADLPETFVTRGGRACDDRVFEISREMNKNGASIEPMLPKWLISPHVNNFHCFSSNENKLKLALKTANLRLTSSGVPKQ